jgi:hypothetical protein
MKRSVKIFLVLAATLLLSCVKYSLLPNSRTAVTSLGYGLSVEEVYDVKRSLFSGLADGGHAIYWPIPSRVDVIQVQRLLKGDRLLWAGNAQSGSPRVFRSSPNGGIVLVEAEVYTMPWELVDTVTGGVIRVPEPEVPGHYYVYPLIFREWLPDSSGLLADASGSVVQDGRLVKYQELWRVDATTGTAARISHTEHYP